MLNVHANLTHSVVPKVKLMKSSCQDVESIMIDFLRYKFED